MISGVGELDVDKDEQRSVSLSPLSPGPCAAERPYPECPYLLLDVRDRELYDQCHIISGTNVQHSYTHKDLFFLNDH